MSHGQSYLVTGGTGFLGSALVRRLVAEGGRVRVRRHFARGHTGPDPLHHQYGQPKWHPAKRRKPRSFLCRLDHKRIVDSVPLADFTRRG